MMVGFWGGPEGLSPIFVLKLLLLLLCVGSTAAKLSNHGSQLSACFKLRYKSIDQGQRMGWHFATGKQYDHQFRPGAFHFESDLVYVHPGHLVVEEHRITLAHGHKSESLLRR